MRHILPVCLLLSACAALPAADIDYDAELQLAMRLYPPGDYGSTWMWSPFPTPQAPKVAPDYDLLTPVEVSEKDAKTLSSEAASYFIAGRWDLAVQRYKQLLLADPENTAAKAHLADIVAVRTLYSDAARRPEASKMHAEMCKELSKEIIPNGAK